LLLALIACCAAAGSYAQEEVPAPPPREAPRPRDFGSSLRRLKWDEKKKAAVEIKSGKKGQAGQEEEDVVRVETTLVACDVLVVDKDGRSVSGLTRDDFVITEDGGPQKVATFSLGGDAERPRSFVLVIDYSGSQLPYINNSIAAAKGLVDQLNPKDRMAVVTDDVELLVDFTRDRAKLKAALEELRERATAGRRLGRSRQFCALLATLKELVSDEERPIIIFQTDGDELGALRGSNPGAERAGFGGRQFGIGDVFTAAQKSRTTIYTIIPGVRLVGYTPEQQLERARTIYINHREAWGEIEPGSREKLLSREPKDFAGYADRWLRQQMAASLMARATGGWTEFLERPEQAAEIYKRILKGINLRYVIGYYPTNKEHDGKLRKVRVEVRGHPDYTVVGRKAYYAPDPD
ncbi:MAG TPA: VWA domain-containing protein, partial [Pyrinomonadaceae bacterium]